MGYDDGWFGFVFGAGWAAPGAAGDFDCGAVAGGGGWWVFGGCCGGVGVGLFFLFLGGLEVVEIQVVVVGIERLMLWWLVVLEIRVLTHVGKQGICVMILSLPLFAFHDLPLSLSRSIRFD